MKHDMSNLMILHKTIEDALDHCRFTVVPMHLGGVCPSDWSINDDTSSVSSAPEDPKGYRLLVEYKVSARHASSSDCAVAQST